MLAVLLSLLAACDSEPAAKPAPVAPPPAAAPAAAPPATIDPAAQASATRALAPSPAETRKAVESAGISVDLAKLVPQRTLALDGKNADIVAVRTGVTLADTVLTLREADTATLVTRMESIHLGLKTMGAGSGLLATLESLTGQVRNEAISRDALLDELDAIVGSAVPEEGMGPNDRTGPLLQAGAWAATTNLVAAAIVQTGKYDAAEQLLRQKDVVEYFRKYVKEEGAEKADAEVLKQLGASLAALSEIAGKPSLGEAEVKDIQEKTGELLKLL